MGSRHRAWGVVLVIAAAMVCAPPAIAADDSRLSLPAPEGGHRVGSTSLHLVDTTRTDPLAPTVRARELMVHLWYPAARSSRAPVSAYMPPNQAAVLTRQLSGLLGATLPADLLTFPTHSRADAPAAPGPRRPVLLFSPGSGINVALYTGLFEELASRGYVVAGIDHTFDAPAVEFPGGRVEIQSPDARPDDPRVLALRVADTRFVLDQLAAGHRRLPLDLTRVGMFGHSLGSLTTVGVLDSDPRVDVGVALDGNPLGAASLARPFLMLGNPGHRRAVDADWANFYDRLRGPRLHLVVDGTGHNDFSDVTVFKHAIDLGAVFEVGPIDGARSLTIQRRYLTAWLDRTLRDRHSHLLDGESPRFPEVDFQP